MKVGVSNLMVNMEGLNLQVFIWLAPQWLDLSMTFELVDYDSLSLKLLLESAATHKLHEAIIESDTLNLNLHVHYQQWSLLMLFEL